MSRSDKMLLPLFSYKKTGFCLACPLLLSVLLAHDEASCYAVSCAVDRPTWQELVSLDNSQRGPRSASSLMREIEVDPLQAQR